jgi:hypothetical protein
MQQRKRKVQSPVIGIRGGEIRKERKGKLRAMNSIAQTSFDMAYEIQALAYEFMHEEGLVPVLAYARAAGLVDGLLTWAGERDAGGSVWRVAEPPQTSGFVAMIEAAAKESNL